MRKEATDNYPVGVQENNGPAVDRFRDSLKETVRLLAREKGLDFDDLPIGEQLQRMMRFLQGFYGRLSQELSLSLELEERVSSSGEEKQINPEVIELAVSRQGGERSIKLGGDRKRMLAYFTLLSERKIQCGLVPWITRRELTEYVQPTYSLAQLDTHLFDFWAESGLLEVSRNKGYRLAARPSDIWEVLQGEESHYSLKLEGFESWIGSAGASLILIEEYQLSLIRAVFNQCRSGCSKKEYLRTLALQESTGLSRDTIYADLRNLEKLGIIKRARITDRYRVGDVNQEFVAELLARQEKPVVLRVKFKEASTKELVKDSLLPLMGTDRAKPLNIRVQEEFEFPEISWQAGEVDIKELDLANRQVLGQIYQILVADLQPADVFSRDKRLIYSGNLPDLPSVGQKAVLGILDFLGFGSEELKICGSDTTLAAAIRRLETGKRLKEQLFAGEVKSRLLSLVFGEVVLPEEGGEYAWADLLGDLENSLEKKVEEVEPFGIKIIPAEPPIAEQEKMSIKEVVEEIRVWFVPNRKLLELMEPITRREISFALNQPSIQVGRLPPTAVFNYHRNLSSKADLIPWSCLSGLGLVEYEERDYHPRIGPGGALLTALFLNSMIHNRAMAVTRGETKAMQAVAAHLTHLLLHRSRDKGELSEREKKYLENCLRDLENTRLLCSCEECQLK